MTLQLHTPFEDFSPQVKPRAHAQTAVLVSASTLRCVWQLHTWVDGWEAFSTSLELHFTVPDMGCTVHLEDGTLVVRSAPEELLLINDNTSNLIEEIVNSVSAENGSALDLSHARCRIQVRGQAAALTLKKLFALDFRPSKFPVGAYRSSGFHHTPAALYRANTEDFDIFVYTTYSQDQLKSILDAALEYGYRFENGIEVERD